MAPSTISIGNPSGEPQIGDPIGAVTLTPGSGANTSLYGGGDISGAPGMGGAPAPVSTDDLYPPLQIDLADGLPAKLFGAAQSGLTAAGQLGGVPPPSVGPGIVQKAFGAIDSTVNTVSQALNTPLVNALGSAFQAQGPASPGAPIPGAAAQLQESSTVGLGDPNEEAAAGYGR